MISKLILAILRNLLSMSILRRPQSLILVKQNNVDTYTKLAVNAKEYNQAGNQGLQFPDCTQKYPQ
jgi:hypothetical protein